MIVRASRLFGEKAAYLYMDKAEKQFKPISYNKLRSDVFSLGTALMARGFSGKNIAVIGENRYEWLLTYFAVSGGVGVIVPLDKELPPRS